VEVIRIDGVEFEREDAREFYKRVVIYFEAGPPSPGNPETQRAVALAGQIYACLRDKDCIDVTLWDETKVVASAVLAEWVQSRDAPDAARTLHLFLAS
jgi:hypothetical protein